MTDLPTQYPGLFRSEKFAPREQFSISQIEKAFGAGYECLGTLAREGAEPVSIAFGEPHALRVVDQGTQNGSGSGCLRSWGWRYLQGIKQPEYTWSEACALPEDTEPLRRLKGGAKAKTWGKVAEVEIERFLRNDPSLQTTPLHPHVLVGLHLLPHPSEMVSYELQAPIHVRTNAHGCGLPGGDSDTISWQGFKDFVPTIPVADVSDAGVHRHDQRFLIDFKTTKPIVNKKENIAAGRHPSSWAYMKDPSKLLLDWQYNLYQWDELVSHGALVPARWVYFASPGTEQYPNKPEARASDMPFPDLEIVRGVVLALDARARVLRDYIRQSRTGALTAQDLPANLLACGAYGGCPYRASVGGPCTAEQTEIVPIGRVVPRLRAADPYQPAQTPTPAPIGPGFTFTPNTTPPQPTGDNQTMPPSIMDQIKAQMAAQGAPGAVASAPSGPAPFNPGAPPPAAVPHAPGYPQSAAAHIGAPVPTAGMPPSFPAVQAPSAAPAGPFNPAAFSFGGQGPQAPAPVAAPAPASVPAAPKFGDQANTEWCHDGQGGYFAVKDIPAMLAAGHPQALALWGGAVAVQASPTPGLPPEAFAPGGPAGPPVLEPAPVGAPAPADLPVPTTIAPADAGKRKRRTKAEMAADALQANADSAQYPRAGLQALEGGPGFEPRDTDHSELAPNAGERIATALETIALLLQALTAK